jgi:hypothetical protein
LSQAQKVSRLSWKGYSSSDRVSLDGWVGALAHPVSLFEKIPYCAESISFLRESEVMRRLEMQQSLFDKIDHSAIQSIYLGIARSKDHQWILQQIELYLRTAFKLVQILAADDLGGAEVSAILNKLAPDKQAYFGSALETSIYFYTQMNGRNAFRNLLDSPFYMELGVDILANGLNLCLAELQVRYTTPYPHLLQKMNEAYESLHPELFEQFKLRTDKFPEKRLLMLQKALELFSARAKDIPQRLVIDAWGYLANEGANQKRLAADLNMKYVLFDDLNTAKNVYQRDYRDGRICIFNQPPLNLLDPSEHFFAKVNHENFEEYEELGWPGLFTRYLDEQVFLLNPPPSDILNDKALYAILPELCQMFFGCEIELPVVNCRPCWDLGNPLQPNQETLQWARENKDQAVIAHRYLEGGLGIRVGPVTTSEEWENFLATFVSDRPQLYVIRDYFKMQADTSLRLLSSFLTPDFGSNADPEMLLSESIFARVSNHSPLSADNHVGTMIFGASPDAPAPRYTASI